MRTLAIICFVALAWTGTAVASPIGIELTSGGTTDALNAATASALNALGADFAINVRLPATGGFFTPSAPYPVGTPIVIHAGWSGIDAPGTITYQGLTYPVGLLNGPSVTLDFRSDSFIVPPLDGPPVMLVPFTLTGSVFGVPDIGQLDLHGVGTMEFTFSAPFTGTTVPNGAWFGGKADFTIEQTPEPSAIVTIAAALGGLSVMSRRRFRSWIGADAGPRDERTEPE